MARFDPEALGTKQLATRIMVVARNLDEDSLFGTDKAFISEVWHCWSSARCRPVGLSVPMDEQFTLPEFKRILVLMNRRGFLRLSRADLVEIMDPDLVAESEVEVDSGGVVSRFHFINL